MAIIKGDYLENFITIFVLNSPVEDLTEIYDKFILQCGPVQKFLTPAQEIQVTFTEQESLRLKYKSTCWLAGITKDGHKETFNGYGVFEVKDNRVIWEPSLPPSDFERYRPVISDTECHRCGICVRFVISTYDSTVTSDLPTATTHNRGIVRIATEEEAAQGERNDLAITPYTLRHVTNTYIHEQSIASDEWVIEHNLGKYPSYTVVDSSGCVQVPDEIIYNDDNVVTFQFIAPFAGYAYLN